MTGEAYETTATGIDEHLLQATLITDSSPLPSSLEEPIDFEAIGRTFDEEFAQRVGTVALCGNCRPKLETRVTEAKHWLMSGRYRNATAAVSGALQRISCTHIDTVVELQQS